MPEADEVVDDEIKLRLDKTEFRENLMQQMQYKNDITREKTNNVVAARQTAGR